jgi:hypothetical protein
MCIFCARAERDWTVTRREQVLELLAQLERPEGLRHDDALSLGAQLLSWTESELSRFRCQEAVSEAPAGCKLSEGRLA